MMSRLRKTFVVLASLLGGVALLWPTTPTGPAPDHPVGSHRLSVTLDPRPPLPDIDAPVQPDVFELLRRDFISDNPPVPLHAILASIAAMRDPRAAALMIEVLDSSEPIALRRIAAAGLEPFADRPDTIRALTRAARSDPDRHVRAHALRSLAAGDSPEYHRTLERCRLDESDPVVSSLIAHLLEDSR